MKQALTRKDLQIFHFVNGEKTYGPPPALRGDASGLSGNVTNLSGNVTGLRGDVTDYDRNGRDDMLANSARLRAVLAQQLAAPR